MPLRNQLADFSQVDVMQGRANAAATEGACHNFAIHWVSLMFEDKGDLSKANDRMQKLARGGGEANPVLQKVFGNQWSREGADNADQMMCSLRGLKVASTPISYTSFNQAALMTALRGAQEPGFIYSFWFSGSVVGAAGGAHSIAFYRRLQSGRGRISTSDSVISAFDPNFGECAIEESLFVAWMNHLKSQYGVFNHHWLKNCSKVK